MQNTNNHDQGWTKRYMNYMIRQSRREVFVLNAFWLTTLLVLLQVLDFATTSLLVLTVGDVAVEANPIIRYVLDAPGGIIWFALIKLGACIMFAIAVPRLMKSTPSRTYLWRWTALLYIAVIMNNFLGIASVYM